MYSKGKLRIQILMCDSLLLSCPDSSREPPAPVLALGESNDDDQLLAYCVPDKAGVVVAQRLWNSGFEAQGGWLVGLV
jgi:hypothetical protein